MSRGPMGEEAAWHAGAVYHIGGAVAISQPALKQAGTLLDGTTTFLVMTKWDRTSGVVRTEEDEAEIFMNELDEVFKKT